MFGAPNESLRLIIIYYMFKYIFGIKTTFLESLRSQKKALQKLDFGKIYYNVFVLSRNEFLRVVGAPNEFLRLKQICYFFKDSFKIKTTLLEPLRSKKKPLKGSISTKLVIITLF